MAASGDSGVVIVGGGLGGLAAAVRLAGEGRAVTLLEKNASLGGKANRRQWQGFAFDTGPSLLTLPQVARDLFAASGANLEDYLELVPVRPACRYTFADGTRFDAPGTLDGFREAVRDTFPGDLAGYDRFMRDAARLWKVSAEVFLFRRFTLAGALRVNPLAGLRALPALRPRPLREALEGYFRSPHLVQLFSRYATYNGSDPWRTPATFNVIAYAEMAYGSWHIAGGIYRLVEALATRAHQLGVEIRTGTEVTGLVTDGPAGRVVGVEQAAGGRLAASAVIINADALTAPLTASAPARAMQDKLRARETSTSGFVRLLALQRTFPELACHNVFFSGDYRREFRELFQEPALPREPTVYISAPVKVDPTQAPDGREGWFVLVNVPPLDRYRTDTAEETAYAAFLDERLRALVPGLNAGDVLWSGHYGPSHFAQSYRACQGSLYGPASNGLRAAFFRAPNNPGRAPGLFFCGGSAHPGGGIPLVLTSGRLAAEAALQQS